jgi:hypothetical protein
MKCSRSQVILFRTLDKKTLKLWMAACRFGSQKIFCRFEQIRCISNRVFAQELRKDNGSYVIIMTSLKNLDAEGKTFAHQ